ncbi:MAG: winged helix-turn-helix transcriptional regulator [Pusillimonas sp.]|nr:winged helix-turn-helix transcriptional regulator [Pusillimonas sp.]
MDKINTPTSNLRPVLIELIEMGMTQSEIARAIGLSRATVNFVVKKDSSSSWMPGYGTGLRLIQLRDKRRRSKKEAEHV